VRARAPTKKFNFPRVVYVFYTLQKKKSSSEGSGSNKIFKWLFGNIVACEVKI
jgi:hypothetical protein